MAPPGAGVCDSLIAFSTSVVASGVGGLRVERQEIISFSAQLLPTSRVQSTVRHTATTDETFDCTTNTTLVFQSLVISHHQPPLAVPSNRGFELPEFQTELARRVMPTTATAGRRAVGDRLVATPTVGTSPRGRIAAELAGEHACSQRWIVQ
jgi:hypothetical protein